MTRDRSVWWGCGGTANYRLMAQLPTANFCNWVVDSSNLPCMSGEQCYDIHKVMLDNLKVNHRIY